MCIFICKTYFYSHVPGAKKKFLKNFKQNTTPENLGFNIIFVC